VAPESPREGLIVLNISDERLIEILEDLGIKIYSSNGTNISCFCPFHDNKDTPSFSISKIEENHPFLCFNPDCGRKGALVTLVMFLKRLGKNDAERYIGYEELKGQIKFPEKKGKRSYDILSESLLADFDNSPSALINMAERGFQMDTLRTFKVGRMNGFIMIPVYDENNRLVGFVRRVINPIGKRKYYDKGLPKGKILFNLNRAKDYNEVILVEGPIDAMMVHQAGYPNVVAVMSGNITPIQTDLLQKYFKRAIIFFDNDAGGKGLCRQVEEKCRNMLLYEVDYPVDVKDPCDLKESNIKIAVENKKSKLQKLLGG
jgi:DNA primase